MKRIANRAPVALVVAVAAVAGVATGASADLASDGTKQRDLGVIIEGTTPDGRTYGRIMPEDGVAIPLDAHPDLISAVGDSDVRGYVDRLELDAPVDLPRSPDEAARYMKKQFAPRKLPVYSTDGSTVIDWFTLGTSEPVPGRPGERGRYAADR